MGGHELDRLGGNEAICDHMIELSGKEAPKVCLLPTASGDPEDQIGRFTRAFGSRGCEVTDISLFRLGANPIDVSAHRLPYLYLDCSIACSGEFAGLSRHAIWRV